VLKYIEEFVITATQDKYNIPTYPVTDRGLANSLD